MPDFKRITRSTRHYNSIMDRIRTGFKSKSESLFLWYFLLMPKRRYQRKGPTYRQRQRATGIAQKGTPSCVGTIPFGRACLADGRCQSKGDFAVGAGSWRQKETNPLSEGSSMVLTPYPNSFLICPQKLSGEWHKRVCGLESGTF